MIHKYLASVLSIENPCSNINLGVFAPDHGDIIMPFYCHIPPVIIGLIDILIHDTCGLQIGICIHGDDDPVLHLRVWKSLPLQGDDVGATLTLLVTKVT